jgi:AbrB family looped-hinge helix DNA binding protein
MSHTPRGQRHHVVRVGDRGRVVLPAEVREALDVRPGEEVIMTVEPAGGVRLTTRAEVARRCLGMLPAPVGRDLVAELLEERRAEGERE